MASKITDSGTPFSLATASTTSRSSFDMFVCLCACALNVALGELLLLCRLFGCEAELFPIGDELGLVDVVERDFERLAVDVEHDRAAVHAVDAALQAATAVLRQLQPDLRGLAGEARVLREGEQRPVD